MNTLNKIRYIKALIVGASGVFVNYFIYMPYRDKITFDVFIIFYNFHIDLLWFAGILVSATSNYILNEWWTFKR